MLDAKVAVYTVILPHNDRQLTPPLYINWDKGQVHYWVISDEPHMILPWWDLVIVCDPALSYRQELCKYKISAHELLPEYDWLIWQDAGIQLKVDPLDLVELLKSRGSPHQMVPWGLLYPDLKRSGSGDWQENQIFRRNPC